jgi:hydroxymethylpyrimidine pyrophosphatase-like HAD family hydrolase
MEEIKEINPKEWTSIVDINEVPEAIKQAWDNLKQSLPPSNIVLIRTIENRIEILPVSINIIP